MRSASVNGRFRSRNSGQLVDHNILGVAWISRRLSAVVVPVRGDAVRAVRPALRGRSAATRLEGVEHTATMSGPTRRVGTTSGVRRRLKIPRLLAGATPGETRTLDHAATDGNHVVACWSHGISAALLGVLVPHPVLWTQVNATPPGVARAPAGLDRRGYSSFSSRQVVLYRSTTASLRRDLLEVRKMRPWIACSLSVRFHRSAPPFVSGSSTKP